MPQIQLDKDGFVLGYALVGGIVDGIYVKEIPDSVLKNPTHYRYTGERFIADDALYQKQQTKAQLQDELVRIKEWFTANDYKANKVLTGEWSQTDERWLNYLSERDKKRTRQDEIEKLLREVYV
jgi:hypothetical protein